METRVNISFDQILTAVRTLTPAQKNILEKKLAESEKPFYTKAEAIKILLNGPVFTKKQIRTIKANRISMNRWRTKN